MRARGIVRIVKRKCLEWIFISLSCLLLLPPPPPTLAQSDAVKRTQAKASESKVSEAEASEAQRRVFAISLVISLATEARSYSALALRPRVLTRAAAVL